MLLLAQGTESILLAIITASGGLTIGLLISLVKHANNGDIHINKRDAFMTGDKKDFVRKEVCDTYHQGLEKANAEQCLVFDRRHQELTREIKVVRKGVAYILALQTGKSLPPRAGADAGNQSEIFEAIVEDLNNEE